MEKVDAHVQFDGSGFKTFLTKQEGMTCSFEDHRECIAASDAINAEKEAGMAAAQQLIDDSMKRRISDKAIELQKKADDDRITRAGLKKNQALREVALAWIAERKEAEEEAAKRTADMMAEGVATKNDIERVLESKLQASNRKRVEAENTINDKNWLEEKSGVSV
jgi:hypothetical protein